MPFASLLVDRIPIYPVSSIVAVMMDQEIVDRISSIVGDKGFSASKAYTYAYSFDASIYHGKADMVIQPRDVKQVSEIMCIAYEHRIPVTPRGSGTGLCGSAIPLKGGIVMDMSRMNHIERISVEDLLCVVQPGVVYEDLNRALEPYGFFFPPSPGSGEACQVGGMVALNASGMRAVKYGATRDYVLGLTFVKANGDIVHAGSGTLKDSSGYQLARLMVGSEGTLGIITEVILRITPRPKTSAMALLAFDELETAGEFVAALIAEPLIPSSLELMDNVSIDAVNKAMGNPLPDCMALCMVEVDGEPEMVEKELITVERVARKAGAQEVELSHDRKVMNSWTSSRKSVMTALSSLRPGYSSVSLADDMVLPISKIPVAVKAFQEISSRHGVILATYGHAADGNLHTKMLIDARDREQWLAAERTAREIFQTTIRLGGSVSGEHGVGISKVPDFMVERSTAISTMAEIKRAMDPYNILNPGKLFQWERESSLYGLRYPCEPR
ncbi:MAG: glycolate oxidase [Candidatus Methanomethylophilaceae archaeon]|nr:glycolate oxidase [Candidatus Methanomethylophilaceae archaeon]MDI3541592.1 glycolate oxidase [Candidatus Methanomethylophilaceae archaeon]